MHSHFHVFCSILFPALISQTGGMFLHSENKGFDERTLSFASSFFLNAHSKEYFCLIRSLAPNMKRASFRVTSFKEQPLMYIFTLIQSYIVWDWKLHLQLSVGLLCLSNLLHQLLNLCVVATAFPYKEYCGSTMID